MAIIAITALRKKLVLMSSRNWVSAESGLEGRPQCEEIDTFLESGSPETLGMPMAWNYGWW